MVLERRPAALVPSARFRVARRRYDLQYAQLYYQRLASLRPAVLAEAERRWGTAARHVGKVLDVTVGERCVVIGTVYMDMPLKPNILDEVTSEVRLLSAALARRAPRVAGPSRHRCRRCPPSRWSRAPGQRYTVQAPRRPKYVSDKDQAILEDESGRISLAGDHIRQAVICTGVVCVVPAVPRRFHTLTAAAEAPPRPRVPANMSGVVMAVLGEQQVGGVFLVHDLAFAGLPPQASLPVATGPPQFVAVLSGLQLGNRSVPAHLPTQLVVDWLCGELGSAEVGWDASPASYLRKARARCSPMRVEMVVVVWGGARTVNRTMRSRRPCPTPSSQATCCGPTHRRKRGRWRRYVSVEPRARGAPGRRSLIAVPLHPGGSPAAARSRPTAPTFC